MTISTNDAATSGAKLIYTNVNKSDQASYQTIPIQVADKKWLISFFHDWGEEKSASKRQIESILYIVLWFTGILGLILLHLTGRYFRNEAIIDEHTQILTRTKVSAELANQTKNQFLANISHELRTPLNGISGFAQLLEKKSSMTVEDKKQLSIIRQCSDNLLQLINEILDISTIESHKINIEIKSFDCFKLLNDCIHMCKLKADEKGLALIMNNTCLRQNLLGDEKRIRQVLVNLIDNAIKYTDNGDVLVTASYHEDSLKIAVADSGCGIAEEDIVRIFSPFVQLSVNNFTKEGIGLGLSITQELVNLMGGELKVRSQPGLGSVFIVSLPLPIDLINNNTVVAYPQNSHAKSDQAYVLVVDDSETNLLFLVSMLEQLGCKVDFAMDGQQALALIKQNNYDLALIDINMPIMNGLELVKLIRRVKVKSKLIAVSAYADSDKINQALNAGFDSYLTKPIEEYQLVELIETSLRSRHSKT
jgi:signal transduction histidine kinase/CheY-like chemotaxis protein